MGRPFTRQQGAMLMLTALLLAVALAAMFALQLAIPAGEAARRRATEEALAQAREALLAYAADRPIDTIVGPGYLPCPDLDDDGWAESTCGSLDGASGQPERLGRLPWKTLGLADLRDGDGERLWYAVSTRYKGLLNCAASVACVDMSPSVALGTITVRDPTGVRLHDGTIGEAYRAREGGAVAVVIAPGAPLGAQARVCAPGDCDLLGRCIADPPWRAATCNPANYLDRAAEPRFDFESNADFIDRSDAAGRAGNANGFVQGPVVLADGRLAVNDRVMAIGHADVMPRVMRRVALEVASCLRAQREASAAYPPPVALCAQAGSETWEADPTAHFGRVADLAWPPGCNLAPSAPHSWWRAWRAHVFYAIRAGGIDVVDASGRLIVRSRDAAVLVAGPPVIRDGILQHREGAAFADARQWLEEANATLDGGGCAAAPSRISLAASQRDFNDVAVTLP
jgi:hypothetical protein